MWSLCDLFHWLKIEVELNNRHGTWVLVFAHTLNLCNSCFYILRYFYLTTRVLQQLLHLLGCGSLVSDSFVLANHVS